MIRINLFGEDRKKIQMKVHNFLVQLDYANQQLLYGDKEKDKIYAMDYSGGFLKDISAVKIGAMAFFGDFLYSQQIETLVIQEKNVSTGVLYRNISLPRPIFHLNNLVVIERSQYRTGEMTQLAYNYLLNFDHEICSGFIIFIIAIRFITIKMSIHDTTTTIIIIFIYLFCFDSRLVPLINILVTKPYRDGSFLFTV